VSKEIVKKNFFRIPKNATIYASVELVDFIRESDPEALHIMTSRELNKVKTNYLLCEGILMEA
jgi:hypothetical protein